MLKHIPEIISPKLMKILMEMGQGDDICFCDANFPAAGMAKRLVRADGVKTADLLKAVLYFFPLDKSVKTPVTLMEAPEGEYPDIWRAYEDVVRKNDTEGAFEKFDHLDRYPFYNRAQQCYALVVTGEDEAYSNIILQKGRVEKG